MHPVSLLFNELAAVFDQEGRAGALQAAKALRLCAELCAASPNHLTTYSSGFANDVVNTLQGNQQGLAPRLLAAMPYINWGGSDLREGRIPDALANTMPMCELVGPDGLYYDDAVRVGLWQQNPHIHYGPRSHAAEETFYIIDGTASWWNEDDGTRQLGTGRYVFHRSNVPHQSITQAAPVLTAWRWSGDIGFEGYSLDAD